MIHSDVINNIGKIVKLNGSGDLAMDREFRKYLYGDFTFTIIKICKGGLIHIQCNQDGHFLTVGSRNLNLIESIKEFKSIDRFTVPNVGNVVILEYI